MKRLHAILAMLAMVLFLVPAGCQNKDRSEIEVETDDAEYEVEWETDEE